MNRNSLEYIRVYFEAVFLDFSLFFITKDIIDNGRALIRRDRTTLISLGNGLPRDLRSLAMTILRNDRSLAFTGGLRAQVFELSRAEAVGHSVHSSQGTVHSLVISHLLCVLFKKFFLVSHRTLLCHFSNFLCCLICL